MKVSADRYYDEVNYMDLKVLGTLGLTDDDLADIAKTDGVKAVYGGKTVEVLHDIGESEQVVKLIALTDGVNEPRVVEGRMPEKQDEILVDTQFLKSSGCEIGDQVTFTSGTEDPLSDSLTGDTFTIVGSATLPYYMELNRGTGLDWKRKHQQFCTAASGDIYLGSLYRDLRPGGRRTGRGELQRCV